VVVTLGGAQACESVLSHFLQWQKQKEIACCVDVPSKLGLGQCSTTILFSLILCGGLAAAQQRDPQDGSTLSIEDLMKIKVPTVCGASKFEQKITEAPSFITIITSDEIRRHGYRTFAEVLRRVPGSTIETTATSRPEASWAQDRTTIAC
jgi:outer membrane receptor for monomeric catechols